MLQDGLHLRHALSSSITLGGLLHVSGLVFPYSKVEGLNALISNTLHLNKWTQVIQRMRRPFHTDTLQLPTEKPVLDCVIATKNLC